MKEYLSMSAEELEAEHSLLLKEYNEFAAKGLSLNMARGKPCKEQLDLAMPMLSCLSDEDFVSAEADIDIRNYGAFDGLPEAKRLFGELLGVDAEWIFIGGNSSLNLMYDSIARSMSFGVCGEKPWHKLDKVKFLCPVPGYDRHFAITELFGIEMISIPMGKDGPDMDIVKEYVEGDEAVKGIWCVPMYSNPTGITYSDETVKAFAALKPKAKDFRIYWDNAYCVHHLADKGDNLLNIFDECKKIGSEDMVFEFASTSKISFSGAGIAVMAASPKNMKFIKKHISIQTIGHDKINQLRHIKFFNSIDGIKAHMEKNREIIKPKFDMVIAELEENLDPSAIASYTTPKGGYFISFSAMKGTAKRICELCKNAGVTLTSAGATFPYGVDPDDSNIRIAPTFPSLDELKKAMDLFCIAVKLATVEKLLQKS